MTERRIFIITLVGVMAVEALSYAAYVWPALQLPLLIVVGVTIFTLAWFSLGAGIAVVVAELMIGSKGHLLNIDVGPVALSLRLVIFLAVFLVWIFRVIRRQEKLLPPQPWMMATIWLFGLFIFAIINATVRGFPAKDIFLDANGYLFFALLPVAAVALRSAADWRRAVAVVLAAWTGSVLKSMALLFIFSHHIVTWMLPLYRWIRVTGVGEITEFESGVIRVFLQSHIYSLLFFCALLVWVAVHGWPRGRKSVLGYLTGLAFSAAIIILSGSRSFWVAGPTAILLLFALLRWFKKITWLDVGRAAITGLMGIVIGLFIIVIVLRFPYPRPSDFSAADLLAERAQTGDAASGSRMKLLGPLVREIIESPLAGKGFGATVTYHTEDPRAIAMRGTDLYTTYSFEWGWADIALKFGLFGVIVFCALLWSMVKPLVGAIRSGNNVPFAAVGILTILILMVVHLLTPFLNHPLGIGLLLIVAALDASMFIRTNSVT